MSEVLIKDFDIGDAMLMAEKMRPDDLFEYKIMAQGAPVEMGMVHMQTVSEIAKAAYINGELLCCWGRIKKTILTSECCPWMVATPLIETRPAMRIFLEQSPSIIDDLTGGFQRSWNMVYEGNKKTIRWLKAVGFEFIGNSLIVDGHKFLPFEKRNAQNVR